MIVITKLLVAHFIGDFIIQPSKWVIDKENRKLSSKFLYIHILAHGILTLLLLWDLDFWYVPILILSQHLMIDIVKIFFQKEKNKQVWFFLDQSMHFLSIFIIWYLCYKPDLNIFNEIINKQYFWTYLLAYIFITSVSGVVINNLMNRWASSFVDNNSKSLVNAGKYIGYLERLFVFSFIVSNYWEAIGFLLAAKSVFRFGDLRDSKDRLRTEYILIGTLISFGIAISVGFIVLELT